MLGVLAFYVVLAAGAPAPTAAPTDVEGVVVQGDKSQGGGGPKPTTTVIRGLKGEELICKKEIPVGSRMPVRTCMSAYDWAERNAASLRNMDQMVTRGTYP